MKIFSTLDELMTEIQRDSQSPQSPSVQRFPIRFVFLPHLTMLKQLVSALNKRHIRNIELSQKLPQDDKWLTTDGLIKVIKELDPETDYVVLPFSEVVRFFPDDQLQAVFNCLTTEFENTGHIRKNRRMYLPLVGLHERFENVFWRSFHRRQEWAPIWKVAGEYQKLRVYLVNEDVQTPPEILSVPNARAWLQLWKHTDTKAVVCSSKVLAFLSQYAVPDHAFDLKKIQNTRELISAVYDVRIPIPYDSQEASYWNDLWEAIREKWFSDFDDFVKQEFNRRKIECDRLLSLWIERPESFYRWLLKWFTLSRVDWQDRYLSQVFEQIGRFDDEELIRAIWLYIFEADSYPNEWVEERRTLLRKLVKQFGSKVAGGIEHEMQAALTKLDAKRPDMPWKKAELLTGITVYERKLTIALLQTTSRPEKTYRKIIQAIYPELSFYVTDLKIPDLTGEIAWIDEYFREYRWSKIRHKESARLQELLSTNNANKDTFYHWYYHFHDPHSHPLFQEQEFERIVWIDGLGLEWLPLLVKLIEEHGLTLEKIGVARANLPTTTDCNRFEDARHVLQLDKFIHDRNHYMHPDDLIAEIDILASLVNEHLLNGERTLIVSDHGFSAFTTKVHANSKRYDFANADHEGRCLWTDTDFQDDDDFLVHPPDGNSCQKGKHCLVPLKRVSLHNTPRREVHGGASPEEVLVPLLLVSRRGEIPEEDMVTYILTPGQQEISTRTPHMTFAIEPDPEFYPTLHDDQGNIFDVNYHEQTEMWNVDVHGLKAGDHVLNVEIGRWKGQIAFTLKGGMQQKDLF